MNLTHRSLAAALALGVALASPLMGCDTDTNEPAPCSDCGTGSGDSGQNTGGDTGNVTPDSGVTSDASSPKADASVQDTGNVTPDSGADASSDDDAGATDTGTTGDDAGSSDDAGEDAGALDMGSDMATDTGAPDMGPGVDYSNRPVGACVTSTDCGSGSLICSREAAGGACAGCGDCSSIPGNDTYTCQFGTCVRDCSSDDDCAPGRSCNNRTGLCLVDRCTNDVCPVPWFVCTTPDGICTRASCSNGEVCPAETTCTGGVCVEDHTLP